MQSDKIQHLHRLISIEDNLSKTELHYWLTYSGFNSWQFWVNVLMLFIPLIILFLTIDRSKVFLLGFYGLNFHVWFTYLKNSRDKMWFLGISYSVSTNISIF